MYIFENTQTNIEKFKKTETGGEQKNENAKSKQLYFLSRQLELEFLLAANLLY